MLFATPIEQSAHYLFWTGTIVAGKRVDTLLHAILVHLVLKLANPSAQFVNEGFALELALAHVKDSHDAREVDPLVGKLADEVKAINVGLRIEPRVAARSTWVDQPLLLVNPRRLGMHSREFGSNANHVQGFVASLRVIV